MVAFHTTPAQGFCGFVVMAGYTQTPEGELLWNCQRIVKNVVKVGATVGCELSAFPCESLLYYPLFAIIGIIYYYKRNVCTIQ